MNLLAKYIRGFFHLLFPNLCECCEKVLLVDEKHVCYRCISQLEPSRIVDFYDNEVTRLFEGRVLIECGVVGFRYHKRGILQRLIFQLKYHGKKQIGFRLGREMGEMLEKTEIKSVDYIIPVPLHLKKQRKRGYNQSEWIARGLSEALDVRLMLEVLRRRKNTSSQTKKNRLERFDNMQSVFELEKIQKLEGMHLLLVDDVVTTGSTLIGCIEILQQIKDVRISIACLAKAD